MCVCVCVLGLRLKKSFKLKRNAFSLKYNLPMLKAINNLDINSYIVTDEK